MHSSTRNARRLADASRLVYHSPERGMQSQESMGTRLIAALSQSFSRNWLAPASIVGSVLVAILTVFAPRVGMLMLLVVLGVVCWRWIRIELSIRALAAQVTRGETLGKLEVEHGAWGKLCHAVNGLVQQQRLVQRREALLPSLPSELMNGLLEGKTSVGPTACAATVVLVGFGQSRDVPYATDADLWKVLAECVQEVVAPHNALVQRCGDGLLVVFGLGRPALTVPGLRAALHSVVAVRHRILVEKGNDRPLVTTLVAGPLVADTVTGLGYGVFGPTVTRAQALYRLAVDQSQHPTLCDEETFVALRQLGVEGRMLAVNSSWHESPVYSVVIGNSLT